MSQPAFRTSTKSGSAGISTLVILQLLQLIPYQPLVELFNTAEFGSLLTGIVMYVTARLVRTAANPGAL